MKVAYSLLLENNPKSFYHTWLLVQSLIHNARVAPEYIFVQYSKEVKPHWQKKIATLEVNLTPIELKKKWELAFKPKQLTCPDFYRFNGVVLLDTNTFLLGSIEEIYNRKEIVGKIVDLPNPDVKVLKKVFKAAGIKNKPKPKRIPSDLNREVPTFESNLSGGVYFIPKKHLKVLSECWLKWAKWFNKNKAVRKKVNNINQLSQVAFAMAVQEQQLPITHLPRAYNCPIHLPMLEDTAPKVLHHFNQFTKLGLFYNHNPHLPSFSEAINRANLFIGNIFDNRTFWEFRYAFYPQLGSGVGSREDSKVYKINLLKRLQVEEDETVLDVGCGDLEVLEGFEFNEYLGIETSTEALKIAQEKRPDLNFTIADPTVDAPTKAYDTVICLEVLNHQKNRADYEKIIDFLVKSTKHRLIISGYIKKKPHHDTNHMLAFHEPLAKTLVETELFDNIRLIGQHSDVQVLLAEKY